MENKMEPIQKAIKIIDFEGETTRRGRLPGLSFSIYFIKQKSGNSPTITFSMDVTRGLIKAGINHYRVGVNELEGGVYIMFGEQGTKLNKFGAKTGSSNATISKRNVVAFIMQQIGFKDGLDVYELIKLGNGLTFKIGRLIRHEEKPM